MYNSFNVAERIKATAKTKGISVKELLENAGLGFNTMSNMRKSMPKADNLARIADNLDCSVDYLLGRTDTPEVNTIKSNPLNIPPQTQIINTRLINYYYRMASAGTGQIIFDAPPTKRISIPDIPETRHVDYAISVNGTSMEPTYHDGDILLVEMTDFVEIGETGIFLVNGECYVKERQATELKSLNPKVANIPLDESARCMGKVIDVLDESKFFKA